MLGSLVKGLVDGPFICNVAWQDQGIVMIVCRLVQRILATPH
tara:strand:- start:710 stop:835 length:126 start_codon:yes stop_codon:yes gene_type:complete